MADQVPPQVVVEPPRENENIQGGVPPVQQDSSEDEEAAHQPNLNKSMDAAYAMLMDMLTVKLRKIKLTQAEEQLILDLVNMLDIRDKNPIVNNTPVKDLCIFLRYLLNFKLKIVAYKDRVLMVTNIWKLYKYFEKDIERLTLNKESTGSDLTNPPTLQGDGVDDVENCIICDEPGRFVTKCRHSVVVCEYCAHKKLMLCPTQAECSWSGELDKIEIHKQKASASSSGISPGPSTAENSSGSDDDEFEEVKRNSMARARVMCNALKSQKLRKIPLTADEQILVKTFANFLGIPDQSPVEDDAPRKDLASFIRYLVTWQLEIIGYIERIEFSTNLFRLFKFFKAQVQPEDQGPNSAGSGEDRVKNVTFPCLICGEVARFFSTCLHEMKLCPFHAFRKEILCIEPSCDWQGAVNKITNLKKK